MRSQYKEHLAELYDHVERSSSVLPFTIFVKHGSGSDGDHLIVTIECAEGVYRVVDSIELPSSCEECPYTAPNGRHFSEHEEIPWEDIRWEIISALTTLYSKGYLWDECPLKPSPSTAEYLRWDNECKGFISPQHPHSSYKRLF